MKYIAEYTKVPVVYTFTIQPSFNDFFKRYLESISLNKITNYSSINVTILDERVEISEDKSSVQIYILLEVQGNQSRTEEHLNMYTQNLDYYFDLMSKNFNTPFTFEKQIYI